MIHKRLILSGFIFLTGLLLSGTLLHWRYREASRLIQTGRKSATVRITSLLTNTTAAGGLLHDVFVSSPRLLFVGIFDARQQPVYQKTRLTARQTEKVISFAAGYRLHANDAAAFKDMQRRDGFIYRIDLDKSEYGRIFYLFDSRIYNDKRSLLLRQFFLIAFILGGFSILIPLLLSVLKKVTAGPEENTGGTVPQTTPPEPAVAPAPEASAYLEIEVDNPLLEHADTAPEKTTPVAEPVNEMELDLLLENPNSAPVTAVLPPNNESEETGITETPAPLAGKGPFTAEEFQTYRDSDLLKDTQFLLFDVDYTGQLNRRYGQMKTEIIIAEILKMLSEEIPPNSRLFRMSGQQFLAAIPEISSEAAYDLAEDLRKTVQEHLFRPDAEDTARATISGGISGYLPDGSGEEKYRRCSKALRNAKKNGRNLISLPVEH